MTDFERLMRESLKSVGDAYRPADPYAAKEEFFRRRRQRKFWMWAGSAAAAGAAAAVGFVAFAIVGPAEDGGRRSTPTVTPGVSGREPNVDPIAAGEGPDGISVGGGYAWAVDGKSGALVRIDPVDNSTDPVDIDAVEPEDVLAAYSAVWVTDPGSGDVIRYDPTTERTNHTRIADQDSNIDLAAGGTDEIWALDAKAGDLHLLDAETGGVVDEWPVGDSPVDVAASGSEVWLYDRGAGQVIEWDPALERITTTANVGLSTTDDLVAGLRHVWFYRGGDGILLQIDKETGNVEKRIELGGSFAGLSIDEGTLWAMVNEGSGEGNLYQIDVDRAKEIAEPIQVSNTPYDVAAGYGSVWVTNNESGEVTRVSFGNETSQTGDPPGVVFYYSDGNDIWAYGSDSHSTQVTDTPEPELSPTISRDGQTLVFQRGEWPADEVPRIVRLELDTGAETDFGPGVAPAFGPDGRVAFGVPDPGAESTRIALTEPDGDVETIDLPSEFGPGPIERVAWDLYGGVLFLQTSDEDPGIIAFPLGTRDAEPVVPVDAEGTALVSPSMEEPGVLTAVELCCRQPPRFTRFGIANLVRIAGPVAGWRPFQEVMALDDIFGLRAGARLYAVTADSLDFDRDAGWTTTKNRAWFVGDGDGLWLVNDSFVGPRYRLPLTDVQAIAVNPLFLNE